jgi:hypothetical protein
MRRAITVAVAIALALGGCGSDDDAGGETSAGPADEGTAPGEDTAPPATGAGAALGDGLVVPEGATLAGSVFVLPADPFAADPQPPVEEVPETITPPELGPTSSTPTTSAPTPRPDPSTETWTALLTLEGDPFAVWDALADQARQAGLPVGGSVDACLWGFATVDELEGPPQPQPVSAGEPEEPIDHLRCEATASDGSRLVSLTLEYGGDHPGTIRLEGGPAQRATPAPDPASVAEEVRGLLPEPAEPEDPAPGEPFGGEGNCFVGGYQRFPLPEGASLIGTEGGPDGTSVLAVDEVDHAIDALRAAAYAGDASYTPSAPRELPLSDGRAAVFASVSIDGGGGACDLVGSPDGRFLLVTMSSD